VGAAVVNAATAAASDSSPFASCGGWALLPLLLVALFALGFPGLSIFNYSPFSLVFGLFGLWFLLRYLARGRWLDAVACGLLLGACGLVKQNFGALAVLGTSLGLALGRGAGPLAARSFVAAAWPIVASGAALAGIATAALFRLGALDAFVHQTLLVIGQSQLEAFNDPLPPILGAHPQSDGRFIFLYTPAALFNYLVRGEALFGIPISPAFRGFAIRAAYGGTLATLALGALLLFVDRGAEPGLRAARRAIVVFALAMFLGIFPSAIWSHLGFVLAPVLLVFALLVDRMDSALRTRLPAAVFAWRGLHAALVLAALALTLRIGLDVRRWHPSPLDLPRAALHVSEDQRALLRGATLFCLPAGRPCSSP
jgi:hypothetical protein